MARKGKKNEKLDQILAELSDIKGLLKELNAGKGRKAPPAAPRAKKKAVKRTRVKEKQTAGRPAARPALVKPETPEPSTGTSSQ